MSDSDYHRSYAEEPIKRRRSRQIRVGNVLVGGNAPICVQTMTNTVTSDVVATLAQIKRAAAVGADMVRVSCPDEDSTKALAQIVTESPVPIIADIHFHYRRALEAARAGAACLRINPGNIGSQQRVKEVVAAARDHDIPIRIGVNGGSLEKDLLDKYHEPCAAAMVESALFHAKILDDLDFHNYKISVKASNVMMAIAAYRQLAKLTDAPLHLGITEAGGYRSGTVKSAIGIGSLLLAGIGDTIRVSLSAPPEDEVKVGFDMLKALGLRQRGVNIIACPSCARQQFDVIGTVQALERELEPITDDLSLSIIGCVVNGPGEARTTALGLTGGGNGTHLLYHNGKPHHRFKENNPEQQSLIEHLAAEVRHKLNPSTTPLAHSRGDSTGESTA